MRVVLAIMRREFHAQFVSPIAYVVMVVFLLIAGYGFTTSVSQYMLMAAALSQIQDITLQGALVVGFVKWFMILMLLCLPALSMRLFSEERKSGTIELLLTSPLSTLQLVVGKYLGVVGVFALTLVLTLPYFVLLGLRGNVDWGAVGTTYLGLLLYGGVILALGVFASSVTENQIVAFLLTLGLFLPFVLVEALIPFAGSGMGDFLSGFAVNRSLGRMTLGELDTHYLVLHGALMFLALFMSAQVLDSSRWR